MNAFSHIKSFTFFSQCLVEDFSFPLTYCNYSWRSALVGFPLYSTHKLCFFNVGGMNQTAVHVLC